MESDHRRMQREQQLEASLLVLESEVQLRRGRWESVHAGAGNDARLWHLCWPSVRLLPKFNSWDPFDVFAFVLPSALLARTSCR